jgi:hypothetical protein
MKNMVQDESKLNQNCRKNELDVPEEKMPNM